MRPVCPRHVLILTNDSRLSAPRHDFVPRGGVSLATRKTYLSWRIAIPQHLRPPVEHQYPINRTLNRRLRWLHRLPRTAGALGTRPKRLPARGSKRSVCLSTSCPTSSAQKLFGPHHSIRNQIRQHVSFAAFALMDSRPNNLASTVTNPTLLDSITFRPR